MTEIEQLRERNKELEELVESALALRNTVSIPSRFHVVNSSAREFDALYAKLFPPKPPEAKFKVKQYVLRSSEDGAYAYRVTGAEFINGQWRYSVGVDSNCIWPERHLSALSEEEAGRGR